MLAAAVTVAHVFPFQQAVAAGTDRISIPAVKYHYCHNGKRDAVGNGIKNGGLRTPLF